LRIREKKSRLYRAPLSLNQAISSRNQQMVHLFVSSTTIKIMKQISSTMLPSLQPQVSYARPCLILSPRTDPLSFVKKKKAKVSWVKQKPRIPHEPGPVRCPALPPTPTPPCLLHSLHRCLPDLCTDANGLPLPLHAANLHPPPSRIPHPAATASRRHRHRPGAKVFVGPFTRCSPVPSLATSTPRRRRGP